MSYIEIKAIKAVAALHRGVVNLAIRTLNFRSKAAVKRYENKLDYSQGLVDLAARTKAKALKIERDANTQLWDSQRNINAAQHTVLNLKDDLNKIQ